MPVFFVIDVKTFFREKKIMPRSKELKKRTPINVNDLTNAIKMIKDKKFTTFGASKHFGLPRTTLRRHLKHCLEIGKDVSKLHENLAVNQVFDLTAEQSLVDYIKDAAHLQFGLTLKDVKILAYQFAKVNGKKYPKSWDTNKMAGDYWLRLFRKRYQRKLSLRKPEATSLARSSAFNKHTVSLTYDNFKKVLSQCPSDIKATDIWNLDETGLSTVHVPPKILAPLGMKQVGSMTSTERGTTVTMIAAINAGGGFIPPMLIFPRVNFKDFMITGAPEGSIGVTNPSGWSNESIFVKFLQHFIKYAKPTIEQPVILIMDNHESHISVPAIQKAKDNGVKLITLHPHTSNHMQPLDKTVFGPFKTYFNTAANELLMSPGRGVKPLTIYDIAGLVRKAFPLAFTPNNICKGFSSTGFHPLNENIYIDADFMPASYSDRPLTGKSPTKIDQVSVSQPTASGSKNIHRELPTFILPGIIRPYPKVEPRKETRKGRQKGRSRILTDTPEKKGIENIKAKKNVSNRLMNKKRLNNSKKRKRTILPEPEPSEDSNSYITSDTFEGASDNNKDDENLQVENINRENYNIGDYVIFLYEGSYFVGKVESISKEGILLKSMQKSLKNWKWPEKDDLNLCPISDIIEKIQTPQKVNKNREIYYIQEIQKYWDFY
ncbi:uncharacterized protein LOC105850413 isoform X1 [Hydra vulgaris]|uniref:uncharacterized protein LOC105850413 isoform X1 n=2 Tax=Hydra vulgaris TaxID=6087 RepID=UPI001F5EB2A9|nr:uncharacterized protein LOC105850413 isoform X1 [Hydra vulgaris]XP_047134206.1 uncharacterized protein LOC105850413 isoform X1 [Hydra vulgaris]